MNFRLYSQELLKIKGPHTHNDNRIQSLESQVNLCMHGIIFLPKMVDLSFNLT